MSLSRYWKKRNFGVTPEPHGRSARPSPKRTFVVQKHAASRLHYDFRLELDGTLKSWAVPKGPSLDPAQKRLAVHVEDHPIEYADFEGVIPPNQYGAGTVQLWDRGRWIPDGDPSVGYRQGKLRFQLDGTKLRGGWTLARMGGRARAEARDNWLLIKGRDEEARTGRAAAITDRLPDSVTKTTRQAPRVWQSNRAGSGSDASADPVKLTGARRAACPAMIHPQLATLVDAIPAGNTWLHELKLDGYRILTRLQRGRQAKLFTRNGHDWTGKLSKIAEAVEQLPVEQAWIDGEVVVLMPDGTTSFQELQNAFDTRSEADLVYFIFDLLYLNGYDLRKTPLIERKRALAGLLDKATRSDRLRYSDHVEGHGNDLYRQACRRGLEGIIAKRSDSPYLDGRNRAWVKIKCGERQEFVIGGYTDPSGSRESFGALLLGVYDKKGSLHYAGRVGTGFNEQSLRKLHARLEKLERDRPPFIEPLTGSEARGVHWVKPTLVAEAKFAQWTRDGIVRQASFQGLREDKSPKSIVRERAS